MEKVTHLAALKIKLQSLGALRPEAWEQIVQLGQQRQVAIGESLVLKLGSLAYMADGLLKEYDNASPTIINFIGQKDCFVTRKHNQNHPLKACLPTLLYFWENEVLLQLYQEFNELRPIYEELCAEYDARVMLRMRLLEMPVQKRIDQFKLIFKPMLLFLTKKDMANYLQLEYTNFIKKWNI